MCTGIENGKGVQHAMASPLSKITVDIFILHHPLQLDGEMQVHF